MGDTLLRQIANIIYLNHHKVESMGILEGKMGVILFMYHYAHFSGLEQYKKLADQLLDKVVEEIMHNLTELNFSTGLAGILWGIQYLAEHAFLELENNAFDDLTPLIFQQKSEDIIKELDGKFPVFTCGLYALFSESHDKKMFLEISCMNTILQQLEMNILPISFLNSMLFVYKYSFWEIKKEKQLFEHLLYQHLIKSLEHGRFKKEDRLILNRLVMCVDFLDFMKFKDLALKLPCVPILSDWQLLIYDLWNQPQMFVDESVMSNWVVSRITNLTSEDLSLNGILGWGLFKILSITKE